MEQTKKREKVAVYIDYTLRIPNFISSYKIFKSELFSDKDYDVTADDEITKDDVRFYWKTQFANPEVEKFYVEKNITTEDDYELRHEMMSSFFYNTEHYNKFIDDYSFNLYTDCVVPNPQDIDIINIAQTQLFEIVLVDEFQSKRKVSNTFFFLSKSRIYPQAVLLLNEGQLLDEKTYYAIWNPKTNKDQINKSGDKNFLNWFIDLEKKKKNEENG